MYPQGDYEKTRELLEQGAPTNIKDNAGWTPLVILTATKFLCDEYISTYSIMVKVTKIVGHFDQPWFARPLVIYDQFQLKTSGLTKQG